MAPRRKNLYQMAVLLPEKTLISDSQKQTFVIEKQFAKGGFGMIYSAHQNESKQYGKNGCLAVKVEPVGNGPLFTEMFVFQRILREDSLNEWVKKKKLKHLGLPPFLSSGVMKHQDEQLRFLVMPKYGRSLENYRVDHGGVLDCSEAFTVAKQCVNCLEYMHHKNYVHSDVKADNILLPLNDSIEQCYLVDFGLARIAKSNVEVADKKRAHCGTPLFTSLDAHRGFHPSWRGDLEILAYNIFYWITGSLPWQNVQENSEKVQAAKESFSKNYDREISKLITNACGGYLSKLFAIAYATPYNGKLNYDEIIEIVSAALKTKSAPKVSKKSVIKEAVPKPAISKHETDIKDSNSRQPQQSPVVRKVDKVGVKSKTVTSKKIKSPLSRLSKRNASQHRSPASKSPVIIPGLATWRSPRRKVKVGDSSADRNASSSLSARKRKGQQDATEVPIKQKSPGTDENGSEQIKSSGNQEDSSDKTKSSAKKVQGKPRKSLRKAIVKSPPLNIVPSGRSPEIGEQSALAAIIPGVRNMKHIRRSLSTALLNKYIGIANKHSHHSPSTNKN